jgi:hypothetical protein
MLARYNAFTSETASVFFVVLCMRAMRHPVLHHWWLADWPEHHPELLVQPWTPEVAPPSAASSSELPRPRDTPTAAAAGAQATQLGRGAPRRAGATSRSAAGRKKGSRCSCAPRRTAPLGAPGLAAAPLPPPGRPPACLRCATGRPRGSAPRHATGGPRSSPRAARELPNALLAGTAIVTVLLTRGSSGSEGIAACRNCLTMAKPIFIMAN